MTKKSRDSYVAQKEFIENAAHELQTPLAIAINKLELLLEKDQVSQSQSQEIGGVLDNLTRLTRLNKSLLLLSKIDNRQYVDEELIDFNELIETTVQDFSDFATHRHMQLNVSSSGTLQYKMNKDLAIVLITNLVKNAIVHGDVGQSITIDISKNRIQIQNFGGLDALNRNDIFKRFRKTGTDSRSTGLGLAISKAIADKYDLRLEYLFREQHKFSLNFPHK